MELKSQIIKEKLPRHIAIIMDGNGRWAKKKGNERIFGHKNGVKAVREAVEGAGELGVKFLTLYAFSTENWNRPQHEVDALMHLLIAAIEQEETTLMKNNVQLHAIGDIQGLPTKVQKKLSTLIDKTKSNSGLGLVLALNYSARWEMMNAMRSIAHKIKQGTLEPDEINHETITSHLTTAHIPDPDLMIRTSGEQRISNFLLWQLAYSELYFTEVLWPDFRKDDLYRAIINYQNRERRFGKTSDQLPQSN
ncbi:MAG: isoprenyl transferase [Bacteroidales bacterium]